MWTKGRIRVDGIVLWYEIKHYDEPTEYGIYGGRISKLVLKQDGEWVAQYDREWVIRPVTRTAKITFETLLSEYN